MLYESFCYGKHKIYKFYLNIFLERLSQFLKNVYCLVSWISDRGWKINNKKLEKKKTLKGWLQKCSWELFYIFMSAECQAKQQFFWGKLKCCVFLAKKVNLWFFFAFRIIANSKVLKKQWNKSLSGLQKKFRWFSLHSSKQKRSRISLKHFLNWFEFKLKRLLILVKSRKLFQIDFVKFINVCIIDIFGLLSTNKTLVFLPPIPLNLNGFIYGMLANFFLCNFYFLYFSFLNGLFFLLCVFHLTFLCSYIILFLDLIFMPQEHSKIRNDLLNDTTDTMWIRLPRIEQASVTHIMDGFLLTIF